MRKTMLTFGFFLLVTACSQTTEPPATSDVDGRDELTSTTDTPEADPTTTTTQAPDIPDSDIPGSFQVDGATAINIESNDEMLVVAWKTDSDVLVDVIDPASEVVGPGTNVSEGTQPFAHFLERPALALNDDGTVLIAYTALGNAGGSVFQSSWDGTTVTGPKLISGPEQPETNLVHMTFDVEGDAVLAWLENSTLSVATGPDTTEHENVDDLTCDCCNPTPTIVDDGFVVAYRNLERDGSEVIRDVYAIRSTDGGENFESPVLIADDPWLIDACPFSGPDAVVAGDALLVTWMDARQSVHPEQQTASIWVDRSFDGGKSFGTDLSVATDGFHRWPVIDIDDNGVVHLIWETGGPQGGISYSYSDDDGESFTDPVVLIPNTSDSGNRKAPSLAVHKGQLAVSWVDSNGGHVTMFSIAGLLGG